MIPMHTVFICFLVLFAVIGSLRGWAKEVIVAFSIILALFIEHVLLNFIGPVRALFNSLPRQSQFSVRTVLLLVITIFGYTGPSIAKFEAKVARERLEDLLLGFFLGLINGFLIIGTLLSFLNAVHYGVPENAWLEQQKTDAAGNPILDKNGQPVMEIVYTPGAKGLGGIEPPPPGSPMRSLLPYLPPEVAARSHAVLYIAVAVAFVFVLVVFI